MRKNKLFFAAILCCAVSGISAQRTVYVSPEGNDTWNGDKEKPFQTLDRAFAEAVDFSADTLYINVASGDYHLNKTIRLSGSVGSPVVVRGDKLDMPRFLGGMQVRGWEKYKGNIYRAFIPEVKLYDFSFEQFYVNGKRATWARTPNKPNATVNINCWDTAGQETYRSLVPVYARDAEVAIIVFDQSNAASFESVKKWVDYVFDEIGLKNAIVVSNKSDLETVVPFDRAFSFCCDRNLPLVATSALTGNNISLLFTKVAEIIYEKSYYRTPMDKTVKLDDPAQKKRCC